MSYIICFWDKSKIQVSDEVGEKLKVIRAEGIIKTFELGPGQYSIRGVDKIIPKADAFDVFPSEWEYLKSLEDRSNFKQLT